MKEVIYSGKIGIDIDGVITKCPEYFRDLTRGLKNKGAKIHIVTSRRLDDESLRVTQNQLKGYGIEYDELYFISYEEEDYNNMPIDSSNWYEKLMYQKVDYALKNDLSVFYEDDEKVIGLFRRYAPGVMVIRVIS